MPIEQAVLTHHLILQRLVHYWKMQNAFPTKRRSFYWMLSSKNQMRRNCCSISSKTSVVSAAMYSKSQITTVSISQKS